ncbi:nicotinate phosphoribosyltransferase [Lachnospiraceae bacterium YH-ros2228]|nr:nicotinate phosphoribosyltransferase [Lachnospiraceae bacterium]MDD6450744.1 nicotinate phosphoribosyltransferase [Lachnospiraceae bacterium]
MTSQSDARNLSMVMDLYEMTMANGYFKYKDDHTTVTFDVFYRHNPDQGGYAIFAGLEQVVDYIEHLHFSDEDIAYLESLHIYRKDFLEWLRNYRFHGDVFAFPEGTIMYPNEPILTVHAPLLDAQLIETAILALINHESLIATKASRIVRAADGRGVSDFGARRAHNMDAAVYGARAAYIGGAGSTATVLAGQMFHIPVSGTMAHSWVMYQEDEYTAFKEFAETYPDNCILLVDTYNVLKSGMPNAIRVAKEVLEPMGKRLKGVRIDSGDLAYLSQKMRKMLDDADLKDAIIVGSNSLDEYTISSIISQGGCFDSFGVGERMITAESNPVFGAVYKISEVEHDGVKIPKIKISETVEKITNPGRKKVFRIYDQDKKAVADLITMEDETPDFSKPYRYVDSRKPWKNLCFEGCTAKELQVQVIKDGKRTFPERDLKEIQTYVKDQLDHEIWASEKRFENPHVHYLDMSPAYYEMKMDLLYKSQKAD